MNTGGDRREESLPPRRSYSASTDLAFYLRLKRVAAGGTLVLVVVAAGPLAAWNGWYSICLAVGAAAGIINLLLAAHGNERLLERRSVAAFVLSSFVRIGLFGIVPVLLAVRVPSLWTLGCYFIGFFMPLVLSGVIALRERPSG